MSHNHTLSQEDVLIALDQLDQTVEVMGQIIQRLKRGIDDSTTAVANSPSPKKEQSSPPQLSSIDVNIDSNLH